MYLIVFRNFYLKLIYKVFFRGIYLNTENVEDSVEFVPRLKFQ